MLSLSSTGSRLCIKPRLRIEVLKEFDLEMCFVESETVPCEGKSVKIKN